MTIQLIKSATSIGANFIEVKNSGSKKEFRKFVYISKREASETYYWLQLMEEFNDSSTLKQLQKECQELILILQKIINTLGH